MTGWPTRSSRRTRRAFLKAAASAGVAAATATAATVLAGPQILTTRSVNERLAIACIGVGGRGGVLLKAAVEDATVVAIADVDKKQLDAGAGTASKAAKYSDYRKLFDDLGDTLDAVVVATPDHSHAPATMRALRGDLHCYTEKPLAHSIHEARALAAEAGRRKVVTQMGIQGHAADGVRTLCEWVWDGAIGTVHEVHAWTDRPGGLWRQGIDRPMGQEPPHGLNWDLWLGPAPERPFNPIYHPFGWRGWFDFGTGSLGDMGCHVLDGPFWALKLEAPTRVVAKVGEAGEAGAAGGRVAGGPARADTPATAPATGDSFPAKSITTYDFPARGAMPACMVRWYDAGQTPPRQLAGLEENEKYPDNGCLLVGSKGMVLLPHGGAPRLLPKLLAKEYKRPERTIPRAVGGQWSEWIRACRGEDKAMCPFGYGGPLTEVVLLGCLAQRVGGTIDWDAAEMKVTNRPEANQFVRPEYREGWTL
jgi:predicted dehydrogenase